MEDLLTDKSYDISYNEYSDQETVGTPYSKFIDPQSELVNSENNNIYHIFCTQDNCGTLILRANLGKWVERSKEKLKIPRENKKDTKESDSENSEISENSENSENSEKSENSENSENSSNQAFWVLDDVMAFENISVTNTIVTGVRYLCCPGCEANIVPIGYHDTSMKKDEYLIAVDRVNYSDKDYSDQVTFELF